MPFLTDEARKILEWLKKYSEEHDITIEMPTHDYATITGRFTHSDPDFQDPNFYFGRRRTFSPCVPINPELIVLAEPYRKEPFNFEQLELRIAALTRPGIETVELGGRTYHRINHPYGGPQLEVPCRKNEEHGCPTCKLLEQLEADRRKGTMPEYSEEQGTTVECKDCKEPFFVSKKWEQTLREKYGKDFAMPTRCKTCRDINRERKASRNSEREGNGERNEDGPRRTRRRK